MEELKNLLALVEGKGLSLEQAAAELGRSQEWLEMVVNSDGWKYLVKVLGGRVRR